MKQQTEMRSLLTRACRFVLATVLMLLVLPAGGGLVAAAPAPPKSQPASVQQVNRVVFVHVTGYRLAVAGRGWRPNSIVQVVVHAGPWVRGVQVVTGPHGGFRVGIINVDLCNQVWIIVHGLAGGENTLQGPKLMCPVKATSSVPELKILKGQPAQTQEVRILGSHPANVTLHVGDSLYLWQPGAAQPRTVPHVDNRYFQLLEQGQSPARPCSEVDCVAGFYWKWVAVRTGTSGIDLAASCRQNRPSCALPDFLIRVHIL